MSSDSQVAVGWIVSSPLFCGTIWAACRPAQVLDFLGNSRSYLHVSLQRILVNILGPLSSSHTIVNSVLCRSYWQHQTLWSSEFQWSKKILVEILGGDGDAGLWLWMVWCPRCSRLLHNLDSRAANRWDQRHEGCHPPSNGHTRILTAQLLSNWRRSKGNLETKGHFKKKHTSLSSDGRAPAFSTAHHKYQSVKNLYIPIVQNIEAPEGLHSTKILIKVI